MLPAFLVAHRWAGELGEQRWRCVQAAVVVRSVGLDPICPGCRIQITSDDIPKLERFGGLWMEQSMGHEALVWQLDIIAAKKETETREDFFRRPGMLRHELTNV